MRSSRRSSNDSGSAIERAIHGPRTRPLAIIGPSGSGKTARLRDAFHTCGVEPLWTTARDAAGEIVEALRARRFGLWRDAFVSDPRPLVMEHMEDLRGRTRTLEELRHVLAMRLSRGHAALLTMTFAPRASDVVEWLGRSADVIWTRASRSGRRRRHPDEHPGPQRRR